MLPEVQTIELSELEGRGATEAEQEVLSRYVGWGGLPPVSYTHPYKGWLTPAVLPWSAFPEAEEALYGFSRT